MKPSGLTYYLHDESSEFRIQLAGELLEGDVCDLDQACLTAATVFAGRTMVVDLTHLNRVDSAGRELLERWHSCGARLVARASQAAARFHAMTSAPVVVLAATAKTAVWRPSKAARLWLAASFALALTATVITSSLDSAARRGSSVSLRSANWPYHAGPMPTSFRKDSL